jgi:hypothetical protein
MHKVVSSISSIVWEKKEKTKQNKTKQNKKTMPKGQEQQQLS